MYSSNSRGVVGLRRERRPDLGREGRGMPHAKQETGRDVVSALAVAPSPLPGQVGGGVGDFRLLDAAKLTVPQAARKLGIGETKMRAIIRDGEVPVLNVAGKILLLEQDLEAFLESRRGVMKAESIKSVARLPPAPDFVRGSEHLRRKAS
jgi:excisionase family DNA binding protein